MMITFDELKKLFSADLEHKYCLEILFDVDGEAEYQNCFMGKMPDEEHESKYLYWFGLKEDGSQAFEFDNFDDFAAAPVFGGNTLHSIWHRVQIESVDGCDLETRIKDLTGK